MKVNIEALLELAKSKNWTKAELARKLGLNYIYLFRLITEQRPGVGYKLISGVYKLCKEEDLEFDDYIILE